MSIATAIAAAQAKVAAAYSKCNDKGATMPQTQNLSNLADCIDSIPAGGGGGNAEADENDIVFIDYDGTIRYSYTTAQFLALEAMPDNPVHKGLTAQGWNWTLADAKTHVNTYRWLIIGQNYVTDDGKTRIHYNAFADNVLSPLFYFSQDVTNSVTIDWGDGSTPETIAGTGEVSASHNYQSCGRYIITLDVAEGAQLLLGKAYTGSSQNLFGAISGANLADLYANTIEEVNAGLRMSINYHCFLSVSAKVSISTTCLISHGLCGSYLPAVVVASGDGGAGRALEDMRYCKWISLPKSYTNSNNQGISNTLASYITQMPTVSSAIKAGTFITKAYITEEVYNIYNYTFNSTPYLRELWVYRTTPPTIQASSIGSTHADGWKIYVPYSPDHSILAAYKAASNWNAYEDHIFEMPQ